MYQEFVLATWQHCSGPSFSVISIQALNNRKLKKKVYFLGHWSSVATNSRSNKSLHFHEKNKFVKRTEVGLQ
jgi:hypothetical protein